MLQQMELTVYTIGGSIVNQNNYMVNSRVTMKWRVRREDLMMDCELSI